MDGEDAWPLYVFFPLVSFSEIRSLTAVLVFCSAEERPKGLRFMSRPTDLSETKNI